MLLLTGKMVLLASLAAVSEGRVMAALFAGQVLSRLAPLVLSQNEARGAQTRIVQWGALWCVVPLLLMVPAGGAPFAVLALLAGALACYALRRISLDTSSAALVAASQPVCEVAFYLGAAIGA
jgi:hypothetical protein